jgi:hypothetical protein
VDDGRSRDGAAFEVAVSPRFARGTRRKLLPVVDQRPRTRRDCLPGGSNEARPCRQGWCRYRLGGGDCTLDLAGPGVGVELALVDSGEAPRGGGCTRKEIGEVLGLTQEVVRDIEARALLKLRLASPSPERLGAYVVPDELAVDLVDGYEAVDEDALVDARIERALRGNPEENDRTIAELTGSYRQRVAQIRFRIEQAAVAGWGQKS